ncbi:class I SAM-dependent methyltransferase [Longivirga aurantiaca]|uniref:Class I SAM-dependent methyltransferase n=1 Tax=Longivirga aurantiaca TaxID=1837743 RepID=A0ABW1SYY9_9ACTN
MTEPSYADRRLSFGASADRYDALRPGYPAYALVWGLHGATRTVRDVADVGAGTGLLTRSLVDLGLDVRAYEPDAGMLEQLGAALPGVLRAQAPAESLPLPDASLDAVTAAQAWHWFDAPAAAAEFTRVLRPGGVVVLVWNTRDTRVPWMDALSDIVDGGDSFRSNRTEAFEAIDAVHPGVVRADIPHTVLMTPDQVVGLVSTYSYVYLREDADDLYAAVRELMATHPQTRGRAVVEFPYVTATYRWTRP